MKLGVSHIPEILLDNTDRNRTSPFAFTGNRFEFRAVGSSANCGAAMLALNAAVAEQLIDFKKEVDALIEGGEAKERALFKVIRKCIRETKAIRFDGNGYSEEWKAEAKKRGLDCETSAPVIIDQYLRPDSVEMFAKSNVLSLAELQSRCEVKWDNYSAKLQIESRVLGDLVRNHVLPAAQRYQGVLLDNVMKLSQVFGKEADALIGANKDMILKIADHNNEIMRLTDEMGALRKVANHTADEREKAVLFHDTVVPKMEEIRAHVDELELIVDDELWTLPKYREMLFIR